MSLAFPVHYVLFPSTLCQPSRIVVDETLCSSVLLPVDKPLLVHIPTSFVPIVNDSPMSFGNVKVQKTGIRAMIANRT